MTACSRCSSAVADGSRFCSQCGEPVTDATSPSSDATAPDGTQWSTEVGWHLDPDNPSQERYWNGWRWTQVRLADASAVVAATPAPASRGRSWRLVIGVGVAVAAVGIIWPMLGRNGAQTTLVPTTTTQAAPTDTVCAGARALSDQVVSLLDASGATAAAVQSGADVLAASTAVDPTVTAVSRDLANAASALADAITALPTAPSDPRTEPALQPVLAEWEDAHAQLDLYCAPSP